MAPKKRAAAAATTTRRGGAFVGEGSYGCTFRPSVPCANAAVVPDGLAVSKVYVDAATAAEEMRWSDTLRKLDPDFRMFYYPYRQCKPNVNELDLEAGVHGCHKLADMDARRRQGMMQVLLPTTPDAEDLHEFSRRGTLTVRHAGFLVAKVLDAIAALVRAKLVHQDIKALNVLIIDGGADVRVIDFGLMATFDEFYRGGTVRSLDTQYLVFPPEFRALKAVMRRETVKRSSRRIVPAMASAASLLQDDEGGDMLPPYLPPDVEGYAELDAALGGLSSARRAAMVLRKMDGASKVDVYAAGMMLARLLKHCTDFDENNNAAAGVLSAVHEMTRACPSLRPTAEAAAAMLRRLLATTATTTAGGARRLRAEKSAPRSNVRNGVPGRPAARPGVGRAGRASPARRRRGA